MRIIVFGRLSGVDADLLATALTRLPTGAEICRESGPQTKWPEVAGDADLCIVLQSWSDEFPADLAHALVAACSASRLIVCQGVWCISDGRTRSVWPRAVCVSADELAGRLEFELGVLNGTQTPLPVTAALDEIFAATCE
ncbi:MAG: hypothetical protein JNG89_08970 [Planctomycetaceae bacterium]|nr:hypothetical protein [Planctomycetaceae bacterium]